MAIGISPALPLMVDQSDGPYRLTKSVKQAIVQNFKNLVLTNPGERMMDPDFGVGIREYLFELENIGIQGEITTKINEQVDKYLNSVQVIDLRYTAGSSYKEDTISVINSNSIYLHILFQINNFSELNVLSLPISI